jgi:hypothetical protein
MSGSLIGLLSALAWPRASLKTGKFHFGVAASSPAPRITLGIGFGNLAPRQWAPTELEAVDAA